MKGYWHFPAIGAVFSALTVIFQSNSFILAYFLWVLYLYYRERLGKLCILISLAVPVFFSFYIPSIDTSSQEKAPPSYPTHITGKITSSIHGSSTKIDFVIQEINSNRKLQVVYFKNDQTDNQKPITLRYGAVCKIYGQAEVPDGSRNPGQFDYREFLLAKGITHQVVVSSLNEISCNGSSVLSNIHSLRNKLIEHTADKLSSYTSTWLTALVFGDDSFMEDNVTELFQRWNLSHLMAISGLNIGLLVGLVYFLLVKLNLMTRERAQWVVALFLPVYAILAGGEPSVWRASIMVVFFILLNKSKIRISVSDVLSIAFLFLLLVDRYIIYSIGFQLSFSVTLGLLLSKQWIANSETPFFTVLKISFVCQMVILPLQLLYFYTFQPVSILLNVLTVPYFSFFVIPFMFILLLVSPVAGPLLPCLDKLFIHIHDWFLTFVELVDGVAYFPMVIGPLSLWETIAYYCIFLTMMKVMELQKMWLSFKYGICLVVYLMLIACAPYLSPVGTVTMLDIGQGDSFVIELPYRKGVIMIDAGARASFEDKKPTDRVYKQIIRPFLYSRGIHSLDAVIISHEDTDHMGSLPYILGDIGAEKVIVSEYYAIDELTREVIDSSGTIVQRVAAGQTLTIGEREFYILSPDSDRKTTNENSVVIYTELGGKTWLFTGDIGRTTETEILSRYPNLTAEVLKVAHHGSNSSTDPAFVARVRPVYALVSAGIDNSYGHPHREVLTTLQKADIEIWRTDKSGAVQYYFKGAKGTFLPYLP